MQDPNSNNKWLVSKIILSLLVGALLITGMVFGIYTMVHHEPLNYHHQRSYRNSDTCRTHQCIKQARRILNNMDATVDPCTDFYEFTCGNFTKNAKIPNDQTRLLVALENEKIVEAELLKAYNAEPGQFNKLIQHMKKFYHQCSADCGPDKHDTYYSIKQILWKLKWPVFYKNWSSKYAKKFDWLEMEADFNRKGLVSVFLNTELKFDMRNFSVAYIGLDCTVPTLSKHILSYGKKSKYVKQYKIVINKFLKIITKRYNGNASEEIVDFFLKVEKAKPTKYEMSDSNFFNAFKNVTVGVLEKKLNINLLQFLKKILPPSVKVTTSSTLGTNSYRCLSKMTHLLKRTDKRHIANYMIWTAVMDLLWIISNETRQLDHQLKHARTGVEAPIPLYKLCLNFIDDLLPELSSAMYIKKFYNPDKKNDLEKMVKLLIEELGKVVHAATWMDTSTKKIAKEKVRRISYVTDHVHEITTDKFLFNAYGSLHMTSPRLLANIRNIKRAAYCHMMRTYNWNPSKRNRATLLPLSHVINAFYHPGLNAIAIPTGIAHGFIYSHDQDAYLNFGGIGIIIGHELSHVFDNVGRLYDANGKYVNWWTNHSNIKFEEKSRCFVKQYDKFSLGPKLKINGTLTLGENMADTGGTVLAYRAYLKWMKKYPLRPLPGLEEYTLKQMFWISLGNTWCDKLRPETLEMFLKTDVHSVGNFRVLGPTSNSDDFSRDFNCPANSKMNRRHKCTIW